MAMNCSRTLHQRYLLPLALVTLIGPGSAAWAQGNPAAAAPAAVADANSQVLKLIKAGMPESIVVAKIHSATGTFDTSSDALIHLKAAGATEAELKAVLAKSAPAEDEESSATPASETHIRRSTRNVALPHLVVEPRRAATKAAPSKPEPTLLTVDVPIFDEKNLIDSSMGGSGLLLIAADGHSAFGTLNNAAGNSGLYRINDKGEKQRIDDGKQASPIVITDVTPDGSAVIGYRLNSQTQNRYFYWSQALGFHETFLQGGPDGRLSADGQKVVVTGRYAFHDDNLVFYGKVKIGKKNSDVNFGYDDGKGWSSHRISISGASSNMDYIIGTFAQRKDSAPEAFVKGRKEMGEGIGSGFYPKVVSEDGTVVFGQSNPLAGHILRWTRQGGREDLGTFGGIEATVAHISPDGSSVLGWFLDNKLQTRIFRWSKDKGMEDLGATGLKVNQIADVSADGKFFVAQTSDQATTKQYFVAFAELTARREARLKEVVAQENAERAAKSKTDAEAEAREKKEAGVLQVRVNNALADGQPASLYALAIDLESQEYPELAGKLYKYLIDRYPGDGFAARAADRMEHARDAAVAKAAQEEADKKAAEAAAKQGADQQTALVAQQQQMEQKELAMNACINKCQGEFESCLSSDQKSYNNGVNASAALGVLGAFIPGAGGVVASAASTATGLATIAGPNGSNACLEHQTSCLSTCQ
jgi:hypothetical protein